MSLKIYEGSRFALHPEIESRGWKEIGLGSLDVVIGSDELKLGNEQIVRAITDIPLRIYLRRKSILRKPKLKILQYNEERGAILFFQPYYSEMAYFCGECRPTKEYVHGSRDNSRFEMYTPELKETDVILEKQDHSTMTYRIRKYIGKIRKNRASARFRRDTERIVRGLK